MKTTLVALLGLLVYGSVASADDLVLAPSPAVVQRTTYYAPATVVGPTVVGPTPVTTYYAPAPVVVARPTVTYYAPAAVPVTTYYAPVPVTTYYAPTTTYYAPAVIAAPVGVVRSKVYYPGEPVRNFFKALAP